MLTTVSALVMVTPMTVTAVNPLSAMAVRL